jgi:CheY-like chemotaxis protein
MRLTYKILWVDDRINTFIEIGYKFEIENYLKNLFFQPFLDTCITADDAKSLIQKNKYDLILSDYNMDNEKGDDFIRHLREKNVNTEILFYTAQESELNLVRIDRISFFTIPKIDGYPQFLEKVSQLIDLTVDKLQELTVVRGLVMAETSQLDKLMEDIIHHYFVIQKSDDREALFNKILKEIEIDYKGKLKKPEDGYKHSCTLKIREKEIQKIIESKDFETSRKARAINTIIEKQKFDYKTDNNFYEDYLLKVISIRNDLAHSYSEQKNGNEVLKTKRQGVEIVFDKEKFKEIRQNILEYNELLRKLKTSLK